MSLPSINIENEEVRKVYGAIQDNFSFDDIKVGNIKSSVPGVNDLRKGGFQLAEIGGVPTLYFRTTSGTLYKFTGVAV